MANTVTTSFAGGRTLKSILLPYVENSYTFPKILGRVNDIIDVLNLETHPTIQDLIIDVNWLQDNVTYILTGLANGAFGGGNSGNSGGGGGNAYGTFEVAGQANLVAESINSIMSFVGSAGLLLTTNVGSDGALHFAIDGSVLTVNNTTHAFGKLEGDLNVNSAAVASIAAAALVANNSTYAFGKSEGGLNVNSAATALSANNSTYAFGKSEGGLNVNSAAAALVSNNSAYFGGQLPAFYANASNLSTGSVGTARLGSGTANASTWLRGDSTWAALPAVANFGVVEVAGFANLVASGANGVLTFIAGEGVSLNTNATSLSVGIAVIDANASANGLITTAAQSFAGVKTFTENVAVSKALSVTGNTGLIGNTTVTGFINALSSLQVAGLSTLTGNATLSGFANIALTLQVAGQALFNANATINATFALTRDVSANGAIGGAGQVLASAGAGQPAYWASVTGGGLVPDANSSTSGLINTAAQTLAGNKTWLGISQFAEYYSNTYNNANTNTAMTIDWSHGNDQTANLNANCTFAFTNPQSGGRYSLRLYSGSGGWSTVWPATVLWPDNRTPVQSQFQSKTDLYVFEYDGTLTKYLGSYNQNYG